MAVGDARQYLCAVVWLVASILFSWYAANFGSFNKTYG
jgi:membrane protein